MWKSCGLTLLATIAGALVGAILVSVLCWQYSVVRNPHFASDAQSGMIFLATVPIGSVLGAAAGLIFGLMISKR